MEQEFNPSKALYALKSDELYRGVNVPISDSATFYFPTAQDMEACFHGENPSYLYSRHSNSTTAALAKALAAMEDTEAGIVTSSGMAAITNPILHLCNSGDHIVASHTVYGGTFAFLNNWLKKFNIDVSFVNTSNLEEIKQAVKPNTKLIYTEIMANPVLRIADIPAIAEFAHSKSLKLIVDNTFTPLIFSPKRLGADIVVYSMTKFINGKNDMVAGAILGTKDFINSLLDLQSGTTMLLGPTMDSIRASMVLKNLYTLHIRMKQHSKNAMYLAQKFKQAGIKINYPGLEDDDFHDVMTKTMNKQYGYGGMLAFDLGDFETAAEFLRILQEKGVGYLAVSLGFYKTLFSNSGHSTSSEVPREIQKSIGITPGLTRFSVGLDDDIESTWNVIEQTLKNLKLI
jgi:methionine-gamma-lyase